MIFINIVVFFIFAFTAIISRNYKSNWLKEVDTEQHKLKGLYPVCLFMIDNIGEINKKLKHKQRDNKVDEALQALYIGEDLQIMKKLYVCNKISIAIVIILVSNLFSVISYMREDNSEYLEEGRFVKRPSYNENSKRIDLHVLIKDNETVYLDDKLQIDVMEKQYSAKELIQLFHYAKDYIDSKVLAENKSVDKVETNLDFITNIPNTNIKVSWSTGNQMIINDKGEVINEIITESVLIPVTTILTYRDYEEEYTRYFKVFPKVYTKKEQLEIQIKEALNQELEVSEEEDYIELPNIIDNYEVLWYEEKNKSSLTFLIVGVFLATLLYILMDYDLKEKVKLRNQELLLDYSEVISKFTLLVGAGMSLINAWSKITKEYKDKGVEKRYVYEEMSITYGELMIGTSEIIAYERFGRRIKLIPYLRFSSLIAQNVKKGSANLINQLELEVIDAYEERKELIKRMGEEAGTKLLLPMMLMLVLVLTIIIVPAFLSFQI